MGFSKELLYEVLETYKAEALEHELAFSAKRRELYRKSPELAELDSALRESAALLAQYVFGNSDAKSAAEITNRAAGLRRERDALLVRLGYPADALVYKYACGKCQDTGFVSDAMCSCLEEKVRAAQSAQLSSMLDVSKTSFSTFRLDYYSDEISEEFSVSPRENMEINVDICKEFVSTFALSAQNLLLNGAPGLGKTFLSGAIAREISAAGHSVVYDSAIHIFTTFEIERFKQGDKVTSEKYVDCDLLILDDLGCEATTGFTTAALYNIINLRLLKGRSTIINTNLAVHEIKQRYSPQIYSRVNGEYTLLYFFGEDIRKLRQHESHRIG